MQFRWDGKTSCRLRWEVCWNLSARLPTIQPHCMQTGQNEGGSIACLMVASAFVSPLDVLWSILPNSQQHAMNKTAIKITTHFPHIWTRFCDGSCGGYSRCSTAFAGHCLVDNSAHLIAKHFPKSVYDWEFTLCHCYGTVFLFLWPSSISIQETELSCLRVIYQPNYVFTPKTKMADQRCTRQFNFIFLIPQLFWCNFLPSNLSLFMPLFIGS